jgi:hypothetical protein
MIFTSFQGDQAEGSDWINVLNSQEVFLEDDRDIHLERHQNQRHFLISRIFFSFQMSQGWKLTGMSSTTAASPAGYGCLVWSYSLGTDCIENTAS